MHERQKAIPLNSFMFYLAENSSRIRGEEEAFFYFQITLFVLDFVLGQDTEMGILKRHIMHVSHTFDHMSSGLLCCRQM
jgi:hypothetical protein